MPAVPDVVRRKLRSLREAVERLRRRLPVSADELQRDGLLCWAVERGLQVCAESLFDTGNHILAGEFSEAADEYGQIPARLAARGVIAEATATRLQSLAGFRNILVHHYAEIAPTRLEQGLQRLDDFDAFAADVDAWLGSRGRS